MNIVALLGGWRATAFLAVALAASSFAGVQTMRLKDAQTDLVKVKALQDQTAREYAEYKLKKAQELQQKLAAATTAHLQEKAHAKQEYDRTIADLRSGQRQLRERFTCPAPAGVPTLGAPGSDGGEGRGLLTEDAEFLISESQRADEIVRQLKLAQETIRILLARDEK